MRVLICSLSVGAGHVRAAEAVELALRSSGTAPTIVNHDFLSFMPPAFRKVYRDGYFEMIRRSPRLLGWLYDKTDRPFHKDVIRAKLEQAGAARLLQTIRDFDPDVAVCTHFLPTVMLDRERRHRRLRARIVTVVTDFEVHGMWLAVPSDHYFVATGEARAHLEALGIGAGSVTVSGIPTHPLFAERKDKAAMQRKHGCRQDLPAIVLSAGGFGAANAVKMIGALMDSGIAAQIIAVCGRNTSLMNSIENAAARRSAGALPLVRVVGFTSDMDELMSAADLMIGKPGGLTTSESLVKGLPWVIVNPIPGQEERNAIYLLEQGAGVWCDNLHTLAYKVRAILDEPGRLARMQVSARRLGRPDAGSIIAAAVLNGPD